MNFVHYFIMETCVPVLTLKVEPPEATSTNISLKSQSHSVNRWTTEQLWRKTSTKAMKEKGQEKITKTGRRSVNVLRNFIESQRFPPERRRLYRC